MKKELFSEKQLIFFGKVVTYITQSLGQSGPGQPEEDVKPKSCPELMIEGSRVIEYFGNCHKSKTLKEKAKILILA